MSTPGKSVKKGVITLLVGLLAGLVIGIAVCCAFFGHASTASTTTPAPRQLAASSPAPEPLPVLVTPPTPAPVPVITQVPQPEFQQSFGQMPMTPGQTYTTSMPVQTEYSAPDPASGDNPNWTIGRNRLIQNPCVDPPSSHGRAYTANGKY